MKVRVERIRRGQRRPEVSYVQASAQRRRPDPARRPDPFTVPDDPFSQPEPSGLRLPWRINKGRKPQP